MKLWVPYDIQVNEKALEDAGYEVVYYSGMGRACVGECYMDNWLCSLFPRVWYVHHTSVVHVGTWWNQNKPPPLAPVEPEDINQVICALEKDKGYSKAGVTELLMRSGYTPLYFSEPLKTNPYRNHYYGEWGISGDKSMFQLYRAKDHTMTTIAVIRKNPEWPERIVLDSVPVATELTKNDSS